MNRHGITLQSQPVATLGDALVEKLARRHGVPASELRLRHVLWVSDHPNPEQTTDPEYHGRAVMTAIILDRPTELVVYGLGSAIKSPQDPDDVERGAMIALSRAVRFRPLYATPTALPLPAGY